MKELLRRTRYLLVALSAACSDPPPLGLVGLQDVAGSWQSEDVRYASSSLEIDAAGFIYFLNEGERVGGGPVTNIEAGKKDARSASLEIHFDDTIAQAADSVLRIRFLPESDLLFLANPKDVPWRRASPQ